MTPMVCASWDLLVLPEVLKVLGESCLICLIFLPSPSSLHFCLTWPPHSCNRSSQWSGHKLRVQRIAEGKSFHLGTITNFLHAFTLQRKYVTIEFMHWTLGYNMQDHGSSGKSRTWTQPNEPARFCWSTGTPRICRHAITSYQERSRVWYTAYSRVHS